MSSGGYPGASAITNFYCASRAGNDNKSRKEKKEFGQVRHLRFLHGWRARPQAKTVTSLFTLLTVLAVSGFVIIKVHITLIIIFLLLFCTVKIYIKVTKK